LAAEVLCGLVASEAQREALRASRLNDFLRADLGGLPVFVAHTGYTGEETAFEIFVAPARVRELWELVLEPNLGRGLRPCGLGARDSLRVEAGLPLFGQELEGSEALTLTEAGYGFALRQDGPPFIGQEAYLRRVTPRRKRLLRLKGQGRRSLRAGHALLDAAGRVAGVVTSFAFSAPDFTFHVLAAVRADFQPRAGATVRGVRVPPQEAAQGADETKLVELTVLPRFPTAEEKAAWRTCYARFAETGD
jgi:glycine cleavage system aminomethyltransferase T